MPLSTLREYPEALQSDNKAAAPHTFEVRLIERLGKRFAGNRTFIEDAERIVPAFYDLVGQYLRVWQPSPPKPIKSRSEDDENQIQSEDFGSVDLPIGEKKLV